MEIRQVGTIGYTFISVLGMNIYRYCYQDANGASYVSHQIYPNRNDAEIALYRRSERGIDQAIA